MTRYICWLVDRRDETEEEIEAPNRLEACRIKAEQFGVHIAAAWAEEVPSDCN